MGLKRETKTYRKGKNKGSNQLNGLVAIPKRQLPQKKSGMATRLVIRKIEQITGSRKKNIYPIERYVLSESADFKKSYAQKFPQIADKLYPLLLDVLESKENIIQWLNTPLDSFDNKKAIELIHKGKVQPVIDELVRIDEGIYS